jgi:copper homeostasis protein
MSRDLCEAMEDIIKLGVRRILTSGGMPDVPKGIPRIAELVQAAAGRVSLMPGGGVSEINIPEIIHATGVREIHLSARHPVRGGMTFFNRHCSMGAYSQANEYEWREASAEKIRLAKQALTEALTR